MNANPMEEIHRIAAAVRQAMLTLPALPVTPPKAQPKNEEKKS